MPFHENSYESNGYFHDYQLQKKQYQKSMSQSLDEIDESPSYSPLCNSIDITDKSFEHYETVNKPYEHFDINNSSKTLIEKNDVNDKNIIPGYETNIVKLDEQYSTLKEIISQTRYETWNENYEIVLCSDVDSPSYDKSNDYIVQHFNRNILNVVSNKKAAEDMNLLSEVRSTMNSIISKVEYLVKCSEIKKLSYSGNDDFDTFIIKKKSLIGNLDSPATKNPSTVKTLDIENKFLYTKTLSYEAEENTHSKKVLSRIEFIFLVFIKESYKNIEDYLESNSIQLSDLSLNLSNSLLEKNLDLIKKDYRFNEKEKNELEIRFKWLLLIKECFNCLDILFNISSVYLMMQYIYSIITESDGLIEDELGKISTRIETLLELNKKQKIVSSKINNICNYLNQIMKSENQTSFPKKILIIVSRCYLFVSKKLVEAISIKTNIKCLNEFELNDNLINQFDCHIVEKSSNFLNYFKKFSHVIFYESHSLQDHLKGHNYNNQYYAEFEMYMPGHQLIEKINSYSLHINPSRKLIVSSTLVKNYDLTEILESQYEFSLYERDYKQINALGRIDILIDYSTGCLIIKPSEDCDLILNIVKYLQNLLNDLIIVCLALDKKSGLNENLLKVVKFCSLAKRDSKLNIKLIYLENTSSFGNIVQQLYLNSRKKMFNNTECESNLVTFDSFYTIRPTNHELYLLSLGILNSYQAQYLTSVFSFTDIIKLTTEEIYKKLNPEIINIETLKLINKILN